MLDKNVLLLKSKEVFGYYLLAIK